ncbi:hypothetical protein ScPMuIL_000407 [Solemya velum]
MFTHAQGGKGSFPVVAQWLYVFINILQDQVSASLTDRDFIEHVTSSELSDTDNRIIMVLGKDSCFEIFKV